MAQRAHNNRAEGSVRKGVARGGNPRSDAVVRGGEDAPRCPHARECGGCTQVNVPYAQQLACKDARIEELFAQVAEPKALHPIIGMDDPYHYRNKVISPYAAGKRMPGGGRDGVAGGAAAGEGAKRRGDPRDRDPRGKAAGRGAGAGAAAGRARPQREILCGMYAQGTHHIVPTDECLTENVQAKRIILTIRDLMPRFGLEPYDEDAGTGFLRHAVVRVGHTSGEILVTLVTNGSEFPASKAFCRELVRRCPAITTIVQNVNERQTNVILGEREQRLYGPGFILDKLCGLSFRISSKSFYQVNAVQTEVLYREAVRLAGFTGAERAIDAYCGTGTIGLVAAKAGAAEVVGVDCVASAIRDARQNAQHNGVGNARFVAADAADFMCGLAAEGGAADVLLMDPPRAGASRAFLDAAAVLAPARVVYISCNPETQVRDVRVLREAGYRVGAVQPVDMFPHTGHIESIALLTR